VEEAQLNGEVDTRAAALALLSRLASEAPPEPSGEPGHAGVDGSDV